MATADARSVLVRVREFSTPTQVWSRRLWNVGAILSLRELHDACRWVVEGALSQSAVDWQRARLQRLGNDPGLGDAAVRRELVAVLGRPVHAPSDAWRRLDELTSMAEVGYLARHAGAVAAGSGFGVERLSRALASHLLDGGHSMSAVRRWAERHRVEGTPLAHVLEDAHALAVAPSQQYEVLVPFARLPDRQGQAVHLQEFRSRHQALLWLDGHKFPRPAGPVDSAFLYSITAKDGMAAAELARELLERLLARSAFADDTVRVQPAPLMYVGGQNTPQSTARASRGARIMSLGRERQSYALPTSRERLDAALELAAPLNRGAVSAAISGSWAAIETLLFSSADQIDGDERGRVVAARRLAELVACSWPRAELTTLSYRLDPASDPQLVSDLAGTPVNRERAARLETALRAGVAVEAAPGKDYLGDVEALARMRRLVAAPATTLRDALLLLEQPLRQLYRSRNILLHAGGTDALAHDAALRVSAPLIGAGLDRIAHAYFVKQVEPLVLSSRAAVGLAVVEDPAGRALTDLLE